MTDNNAVGPSADVDLTALDPDAIDLPLDVRAEALAEQVAHADALAEPDRSRALATLADAHRGLADSLGGADPFLSDAPEFERAVRDALVEHGVEDDTIDDHFDAVEAR